MDRLDSGGYGFYYLQDGPDEWRIQVTRRLSAHLVREPATAQ
jgi:uncharacterized protein (DUF2249 family)